MGREPYDLRQGDILIARSTFSILKPNEYGILSLQYSTSPGEIFVMLTDLVASTDGKYPCIAWLMSSKGTSVISFGGVNPNIRSIRAWLEEFFDHIPVDQL